MIFCSSAVNLRLLLLHFAVFRVLSSVYSQFFTLYLIGLYHYHEVLILKIKSNSEQII